MREEKASALPLLLDVRRMDENNRAYAYRMLRKNIMTLQLQPGCQLSEAELCEQLAMSRTPVHEALMMLKSEWLVDVLPQRGSIVSKISVPYLNEGFAVPETRQELAVVLWNMAGKPEPASQQSYTDVQDEEVLKAVCWAVENELVTPETESTLGADVRVNRLQVIGAMYQTNKRKK